jgi:hypothetical protein
MAYGFLENSSPTICKSQLVRVKYLMSVASPEQDGRLLLFITQERAIPKNKLKLTKDVATFTPVPG